VRLSWYFGNPAQLWLELQNQYDIAAGERTVRR
jgi:plasmid maintenance system antidote protein VapI